MEQRPCPGRLHSWQCKSMWYEYPNLKYSYIVTKAAYPHIFVPSYYEWRDERECVFRVTPIFGARLVFLVLVWWRIVLVWRKTIKNTLKPLKTFTYFFTRARHEHDDSSVFLFYFPIALFNEYRKFSSRGYRTAATIEIVLAGDPEIRQYHSERFGPSNACRIDEGWENYTQNRWMDLWK